jgi:hypothetical protein
MLGVYLVQTGLSLKRQLMKEISKLEREKAMEF